MSYTLKRGVDGDGLDNTQRGLLIGLPAIALILGLGAFHGHSPGGHNGVSADTIPVVSSLSTGGSGSKGPSSNNPGGGTAAGSTASPGVISPAAGYSGISPTGGGTIISPGTSVIGGMGGGPTGGGNGTPSGGGATIPDCTIGQIATVNCQVPACSPTVTLAPGQKAILGVNGTCIVVN